MLIQWHHGSGDFATAANWNPASVPGSGDEAEIDAAGIYTVTSSASELVNSLSTVATATLAIAAGSTFTVINGTGSVVNAGTVAIDNGSGLDIDGTVDNTGKITLNATNTTTGITIDAGLMLNGSGKVVLSGNAGNVILIESSTFTNVNNAISGSGTLAGITAAFVNEGVIDATGTVNPLILTTGSEAITNAGILEATGPAGLQIDSDVVNAPTGVIAATGAHAVVELEDDPTIVGGTLKTASGGAIEVAASGALFDGSAPAAPLASSANVIVQDGSTLTLLGTIDNSGTIALDSTGSLTELVIGTGGAALEGSGKIVLGAIGDHQITGFTLTNVDDTIMGGDGAIAPGTLVNGAKGIINATGTGASMDVDTGSNAILNAGLLEATGPDGLAIESAVDNAPTGVIAASGAGSITTIAGNGLNKVSIVGGTLKTASGGEISVIGSNATFDGSTPGAPLANAGNATVQDGSTLTLLGTIDNSGTIKLDSTDDPTDLLVGSGGVALEGGGKIILTNDNNIENIIAGKAATDTLTNVNNTITGSGELGNGEMSLINEAKGVIDATSSLSFPSLILDTTGNDVSNAGLIEATAGGVLEIHFTTIDNASTGLIQASGANSIVLVELNGTIVGGTLKTANGGTIQIADGTLDGSTPAAPIANAGNVVVDDSTTLTLLGTVNNTGTITLASAGDPTELLIGLGGAALEGGGKIVLTANEEDEITGVASSDTLTNVNNTISGAGDLGGGLMTLVNEAKGVIDATGILSIITGANEITNAGLMEAVVSTLQIDSGLFNTGTIESVGGGLVQIDAPIFNNGKLLAANGAIVINDPISGNGNATIDNGGEISFAFSLTGITQSIAFANNGTANATLVFGASATANPSLIYDGTISGFSTTKDRIDFTGLSFTGDTTPTKQLVNGNTVLTVTEGADSASVTLAGNEMAAHFTVSQDSGTGTLIVDPPATLAATAGRPATDFSGASNIALLGSYMAGMFASAEGQVGTPTTETSHNQTVLAHPHA